MIRLIAAMDSKQGIANDHGVPWGRKLSRDIKQYHDKLKGGTVLMGEVMYKEMSKPLPDCRNLVLTYLDELKPGFEKAPDLANLLQNPPENFWSVGGANVFAQTIDAADELHLTQLDGDFGCTKFFPEFKDKFELVSETEPEEENGITFRYQVWKKK